MEDKEKQLNKGEIIIYQPKTGGPRLEIAFGKENIWVDQAKIAKLFNVERSVITKHINNIFNSGELDQKSNVQKMHIPSSDKPVKYYNLDVIISVGYRVNSKIATKFRIWATGILKSHVMKGYTLNQKRLKETQLTDLEQAVTLVKKALETKKLKGAEAKGLLEVITKYADSWLLLQKYDEDKLTLPTKLAKAKYKLEYHEALEDIIDLKNNLQAKKQASDLFGVEKDKSFEGIIGNVYQTFGGKELYPSIEAKAAHLLYFIIKDHAFNDGNKRIGSFLFIAFLARNNYLTDKRGESKFNNNALVALALLIAESDPKHKDTLIKLIMNFLNK